MGGRDSYQQASILYPFSNKRLWAGLDISAFAFIFAVQGTSQVT